MGRNPLCHEKGFKKGSWSPHEDIILVNYINQHGLSTWNTLSKNAGLQRSGKSCRLRWTNYLRPDVNHGPFTLQEKNRVIELQAALGNRWSAIASHLPGRTGNEIKNMWNTHLMKQLVTMGLDPQTHESSYTPYGLLINPPTSYSKNHVGQWENVKFETEACSPSASDYFLELWNSEVGESFRKVMKRENPADSTKCQNPRPPSKSHTAQWESARLEAESRLLSGSKMYSPHASSSDYFLQLWNCEVGDSFRKVKKIENRENSQSRVSEASSFTKYASKSSLTFDTWQASKSASNQGKELWLKEDSKPRTSVLNARVDTCQSSKSATNRDEEIGFKEYSKPQIVVQHARSDSCSNEVDKSSVSCLQLLLDIHPNNDTRFLEEDDMNGYW